MTKFFTILLLSGFMQGCISRNEIIDSSDVKIISVSIELDSLGHKVPSTQINISDLDSVDYIIKALNEGKEEPIKFYPSHRLIIHYENGQNIVVLCSGSSMKYNGSTYSLKRDIKKIIGF